MKIRKPINIALLVFALWSPQQMTGTESQPVDTVGGSSIPVKVVEAAAAVQQSAPVVKKRHGQRPQRIDREVTKAMFIPEGTWMVGGTASYSEYDADNLNFLVIKDVEGLGYTFSVSPYLGYFIRDNVAMGIRFTYNRTYMDVDNFQLNLGEDFNINLSNLYWLEHKFEGSVYVRNYMPIGHGKIFGMFNETRLTYGYSVGKDSTGSGTEYDGTFERTHSLQIGIAPGMAAFITDWAACEVSVGVMGYNFKWVDQRTNQIESGRYRTSSGNFKINLFSINIGMTFYL
jgi:hypothetical protein